MRATPSFRAASATAAATVSLIRGSKAWGRIYSGFNSASLTREAMAYAAAIFIFSVMAAARTSSAPPEQRPTVRCDGGTWKRAASQQPR